MSSPEPHPEQTPEPNPGDTHAAALAKWRMLLTVTATLLTLFAVSAIVVWLGLRIHHTLLLFALGGLVAYALAPLVSLVNQVRFGRNGRQIGKTASVFVVYGALFLVFVGGVWSLGEHLARQSTILQDRAPSYRDRAIELARQLDAGFLTPHGIRFSAEQTIRNPPPEVSAYAEKLAPSALPFVAHTLTDLGESAIVLLIALYLLVFGTEMKEQANRNLPPLLLSYALPWEEDVNRILGGFVRGQLMLALINGLLAAVGLLLLGVHLWLILAIFTVVASLIPAFGTYIAAVPALLAALITPTHLTPVAGAVTVLVLFIVINEIGSKVLYPKFVGEALSLHEVVVLFVLFAGLEIDGIVGALFAAPVASLSIITLVHLYRLWQELPEESIADELLAREQPAKRPGPFKRRGRPLPDKA